MSVPSAFLYSVYLSIQFVYLSIQMNKNEEPDSLLILERPRTADHLKQQFRTVSKSSKKSEDDRPKCRGDPARRRLGSGREPHAARALRGARLLSAPEALAPTVFIKLRRGDGDGRRGHHGDKVSEIGAKVPWSDRPHRAASTCCPT